MLDWLVDNAGTIYVLLGIIALACAALWWMNRKRYYLIALAVVAGLVLLVFLLGLFIVTDRQQIRANILAMRDAVLEGKPEAVFKHFARDFRTDFSDRQTFINQATQAIRRYRVTEIGIGSMDFEVPPDRADKAVVAFRIRATGEGGEGFFLVRADFVFEQDQWRMRRFRLFNPFANTDTPIPIP
jgi:hypothetical protein